MADVDVVSDILAATVAAYPSSEFIQSLSHQYLVRGWLTKKQLQGLYQKASKLHHIPPGKLATLEALLARMPTRTRSEKPALAPILERDEKTYAVIEAILKQYPQHKRVLYLKSRLDNHEVLSPAEIAEAERFHKLLLKP
jgi:hypothetical protein